MASYPKVSNRRQMYQNYSAGANKMSLFIDRSITAEPNLKVLPSLHRETFIFADRRWLFSFITGFWLNSHPQQEQGRQFCGSYLRKT